MHKNQVTDIVSMLRIRSPKVRLLLLALPLVVVLWILYYATTSLSNEIPETSKLAVQGVIPALGQAPQIMQHTATIYRHQAIAGNTNTDNKELKVSDTGTIHYKDDLWKQEVFESVSLSSVVSENGFASDVSSRASIRTSTTTTLKPAVQNSNITVHVTSAQTPEETFHKINADNNKTLPSASPFVSSAIYSLMHAQRTSKINSSNKHLDKFQASTHENDYYVVSSSKLSDETSLHPNIGNGFLATVIHSKEVFMAGLYNGDGSQAHRAVIPSTVAHMISSVNPPQDFTRLHRLNVAEGIYSELLSAPTFNITQRIYAHRTIKELLVVEIDLERLKVDGELQLNMKLNKWTASYDMTFLKRQSGHPEVSYKFGRINARETNKEEPSEIHLFYDHVPNILTAPSDTLRTKWVFLTAIARTNSDALDAYNEGMRLAHSSDELYTSHVQAWKELWKDGRIEIKGNTDLAKSASCSLYHLMSSLPMKNSPAFNQTKFIGISPSGLALGDQNKDYQGRVMSDQEMWILPALLPFFPDSARLLISSRINTMRGAVYNADKVNTKGLVYPFESAATGIEVNNDVLKGTETIYPSSLVSFAIIKYLHATNDTSILNKPLQDVIIGIARFIKARSSFDEANENCLFEDVTSFDTLHPHVNNPAFVAALAEIALAAPKEILGKSMEEFENVSIRIPYDSIGDYHPAYEGYEQKIPVMPVHQADVIFLGFPLQLQMNHTVKRTRENDLLLYEKAVDPRAGPTTWAMFAVGWLEVGDHKKAALYMEKALNFSKNDFKVWTDKISVPALTSFNYISGAAAFIQTLVNGYGGLRYHRNHLSINPVLPPGVNEMSFIGVKFIKFSFDIRTTVNETSVSMMDSAHDQSINIILHQTQQIYTLMKNTPLRFSPTKASLYSSHLKTPETF